MIGGGGQSSIGFTPYLTIEIPPFVASFTEILFIVRINILGIGIRGGSLPEPRFIECVSIIHR